MQSPAPPSGLVRGPSPHAHPTPGDPAPSCQGPEAGRWKVKSDPQVCGLGEGVTLIKGQSQGENYSTEKMTVLTSLLPSWRPPAQSFLYMPTPGSVRVRVYNTWVSKDRGRWWGEGKWAERRRAGQRVLRGVLPVQPTFRAGFWPAAHQCRQLIISEASTTWGGWAAGGPDGPPPPSLPGPTEALPSSSRSGDKILLVSLFCREAEGGPQRGPTTPSLGPGACTQVDILL